MQKLKTIEASAKIYRSLPELKRCGVLAGFSALPDPAEDYSMANIFELPKKNKQFLAPIAPDAPVDKRAWFNYALEVRSAILEKQRQAVRSQEQSVAVRAAREERIRLREAARAKEAQKAREMAAENELERLLKRDAAQEEERRAEEERCKAEAAAARREPTVEEIKARAEAEVASLEAEKHGLEVLVSELEDKVEKLQAGIVAEAHRTAHWQNAYAAATASGCASGAAASSLMVRLLTDPAYEPTAVECLECVQALRPDRLIVLPSALKSAEEVEHFQGGRRLLSLLLRLVTVYGDEVISRRKGDSSVFTDRELVHCETEITRTNKELAALRTFEWQGMPILMEQHLRIGVAQDTARTLRVYFDYVPEEKRFIIGWCGEHLPTTCHRQ